MIRFRHLQHTILAVMLGCGIVLSIIFSLIAFTIIQRQAVDESQQLTRYLIGAVKATASVAVFAGNEKLGQDAIDGLLGNEAIYAVTLVGFADGENPEMMLKGSYVYGGSGLTAIVELLKSPFDDQVLGELRVQPNVQWVQRNVMNRAFSMIAGLVVVIFSSCLLSAQLIKWLVSKPLVDAVSQLQKITPSGETRLQLPKHLTANEVGLLVAQFNLMLDGIKQGLQIEQELRQDMELVQLSLEKAKQVAELATVAKSNFLATMSHEIRTPMNSILGFVELGLEDDDLSTETRRHLQIAHSSANFLLQLINDILDVSKIETGKLELDIQPFDLRELLADIYDLMDLKARQKGLKLTIQGLTELAAGYMGDSYRLRQILINLLGNAIKFTEKGEIELSVIRTADNRCLFSIEDTGIGIAEDKIDQILQPFTQVDASISRQFGGTGLGTTISSELVQIMGGKLEIQSTLGVGSRFYFVIPLEPTVALVATKTIRPTSVQSNKALSILLVDDVLENITLAQIRLEKAGHVIVTAENGRLAAQLTEEFPFDLILMDIQMPEMDGYEATRLIRSQNNYNATMPIWAMTANAMKKELDQAIAAGMDDCVIKPIDFGQLFAKLQQFTNTEITGFSPRSSNVAIKGQTRAFVTEEKDLLPIIDELSGLASWLDEKAYFNALQGFAQRNRATAVELAAFIQAGDHNSIEGLLHKVKGAAGNLRLIKLYRCTCFIEEQLTPTEPIPNDNLFQSFDSAMTSTLQAIEQLSTPVQTVISVPLKTNIGAMGQQCFIDALAACEQHDPDAAEQALAHLGHFIQASQLSEINHKLQQFDFSRAMLLIQQLASTLAVEMDNHDRA